MERPTTTQQEFQVVHTSEGAAFLVIAGLSIIFALVAINRIATLPVQYDESITIMQLAGYHDPSSVWPFRLAPVSEYMQVFQGLSSFADMNAGLRATDIHPPLYYWASIVAGSVFGVSDQTARGVSLLIVLIAAFALVRTARVFGATGQMIAALAVFASPSVFTAATFARDYGMAFAFSALCLVTVVGAIRGRQLVEAPRRYEDVWIVLSGVFGGLAILSHYFAAFAVVPTLVGMAIVMLRRRPFAVLVAAILCLLLISYAASFAIEQMNSRPNKLSGYRGLAKELETVLFAYMNSFTVVPKDSWRREAAEIVCSAIFFLMLSLALAATPKNLLVRLLVLSILAHAALVLTFLALADRSLDERTGGRYLLFIFPHFVLLLGYAVGNGYRMRQKLSQGLAVGVAIAVIWLALIPWTGDRRLHVIPWTPPNVTRNALEAINAFGVDEALLIVPNWKRGHVGHRIYNMPTELSVFIPARPEDFPSVAEVALKRDLVILTGGTHNALREAVDSLKAKLASAGFTYQGSGIWVAQSSVE